MEFFITIYNLFLFQPIFNALIWLSQNVPGKDFGVAVILLTVVVRLVSYPLGAKAIKAQKKFAELQPKIKEVQEKFKNKREEQTKAMADLFREANINPFASFAPFFIQIPIFIVLYHTFSGGFGAERFSLLYSFVEVPEQLNTWFLGFIDLNTRFFPLALAAGALQFLRLKQMEVKGKKEQKNKEKKSGGKPDFSSLIQKQMLYILPVLIIWIASRLPAAFGLYIITTTVFDMWQQWFITKRESHTP
ncbi:MAG TPA: YidC/Oxa1 family membrane protein insertase [Candidatus Paceibacterota bacterium]